MKKIVFITTVLIAKMAFADALFCKVLERDFSKSNSAEIEKMTVEEKITSVTNARYGILKFEYNGEKYLYRANGSVQSIHKENSPIESFLSGNGISPLSSRDYIVQLIYMNGEVRTLVNCGMKIDSVSGPAMNSLFRSELSLGQIKLTCSNTAKSDGLLKTCGRISELKNRLSEAKIALDKDLPGKFDEDLNPILNRMEKARLQYSPYCVDDYKSEQEKLINLELATKEQEDLCSIAADLGFKMKL